LFQNAHNGIAGLFGKNAPLLRHFQIEAPLVEEAYDFMMSYFEFLAKGASLGPSSI